MASFQDKIFQLTAKTFHGLEEPLAQELSALGATDIQVNRRVVYFKGDLQVMYLCNHRLRTAINILLPLHSFTARSEQELYDGVRAFNWDSVMKSRQTFMIQSTVRSETFTHSHYAGLKTKDAIADFFRDKFGQRPSVNRDYPDVIVDLNIRDQKVTLSLNSSGQPLFKRGYRRTTGEAPLNEVLAAGMIKLTEWDVRSPLIDPMCGGGTIPIEAGMMAANVPAGHFRKFFGFIKWINFDQELWDDIKAEGADNIIEPKARVKGTDVSMLMVKKSRRNAELLDPYYKISFSQMNIKDMIEPMPGSLIIMNPPYGERISEMEGIKDYHELGDLMKERFGGSTVWILSGDRQGIKHIGLKTSKKINLYNGPIECTFRKYEMH